MPEKVPVEFVQAEVDGFPYRCKGIGGRPTKNGQILGYTEEDRLMERMRLYSTGETDSDNVPIRKFKIGFRDGEKVRKAMFNGSEWRYHDGEGWQHVDINNPNGGPDFTDSLKEFFSDWSTERMESRRDHNY